MKKSLLILTILLSFSLCVPVFGNPIINEDLIEVEVIEEEVKEEEVVVEVEEVEDSIENDNVSSNFNDVNEEIQEEDFPKAYSEDDLYYIYEGLYGLGLEISDIKNVLIIILFSSGLLSGIVLGGITFKWLNF